MVYDFLPQTVQQQITEEVGAGFAFGMFCGTTYHFTKGIKNSPKGNRLIGALHAVRLNSPRVAGVVAAWSGLTVGFSYGLYRLRQKIDSWNATVAGLPAGALLGMRHGVRAASRAAILSTCICGGLEACYWVVPKWKHDRVREERARCADEQPML